VQHRQGMDDPDLEDLIRRHRRYERHSRQHPGERGPLDPTMDELVSTQFEGQPLFVTVRLDAPDGRRVTARVYNDHAQLAKLRSHGWVEADDNP